MGLFKCVLCDTYQSIRKGKSGYVPPCFRPPLFPSWRLTHICTDVEESPLTSVIRNNYRGGPLACQCDVPIRMDPLTSLSTKWLGHHVVVPFNEACIVIARFGS